MTIEQLKNEIGKLDLADKLLLVEDVWDSIAADNHALPMPEWHRSELERRLHAHRTGEADLHDWKQVHQTIREQYK
ncbi:MAG: addiction module protein [Candidatus Hydrogenedentes bacterium]|nr:addiction module protein [Candidatus Hydrogenedentota bacterium]